MVEFNEPTAYGETVGVIVNIRTNKSLWVLENSETYRILFLSFDDLGSVVQSKRCLKKIDKLEIDATSLTTREINEAIINYLKKKKEKQDVKQSVMQRK